MQAPPGIQKHWLWHLAQLLERAGFHRHATKLYRKALLPEFRHNHHCGPDFNLVTRHGRFEAYWCGRRVLEGGIPVRLEKRRRRPCLILGSGPSVNELDDQVYAECDIFAANGSIVKCAALNRRACAYIVQDPNFIETSFDIFKRYLDITDAFYLSSHVIAALVRRDASLLKGRTVYLLERVNRAFEAPRLKPVEFRKRFGKERWLRLSDTDGSAVIGWSLDSARGVFTGSTVVYSALQLSVFTGYDSILLAGIDFSAGAAGARFYNEHGNPAVSHLDGNFTTQILPSFTLASEILRNGGIRVVSLSTGSRLPEDVFPKLSSPSDSFQFLGSE